MEIFKLIFMLKEIYKSREIDLRTHIAIEFTKALAGSTSFITQYINDNGVYSDTFKGLCKNGIELADELIKQLNKDEK